MLRLIKRFFGNLPFMEKLPCESKSKIGDTIYFCTRQSGHLGPHLTYLGKIFWPWHWKQDEK